MLGTAETKVGGFYKQRSAPEKQRHNATHVHKMAWPRSANERRNWIIAHADCESKPEVG